jgi:2-polyprenyl-3-methyl-5-hydroxy-6-metoxy-1,4-benzoquinol methylase
MQSLIAPRFKFNANEPYRPSISKLQLDLINLVQSKLDSKEYRLQDSECPCGIENKQDVVISEIDRYGFPLQSVLCISCGTVRFDPYLDEQSLGDFYTHIYRKMYGMDLQADSYEEYLLSQADYARKILSVAHEFLKPDSWICEVGCGGGGALKFFQDQGFNAVGCDYDAAAMASGKQKGINNLFYGSLDTLQEKLGTVKFDLIYLHHVFEHLNDPIIFLQQCRGLLSENGKIIVIVPDISRIDKIGHLPALGNLLMYLHIAHKYNFSYDGLRRLCHRTQYSAIKLNPDNRIKTRESQSPELWIQMSVKHQASTNDNLPDFLGYKMLKYLQSTEKLYSLGLCQGQVLHRLSSFRSPDKIAQKLLKRFKLKKKWRQLVSFATNINFQNNPPMSVLYKLSIVPLRNSMNQY